MKKGDTVTWKWGKGIAKGMIIETFTAKVTRHIKGADVTRNASPDDPAHLIEQEDGDHVLKSASELDKA